MRNVATWVKWSFTALALTACGAATRAPEKTKPTRTSPPTHSAAPAVVREVAQLPPPTHEQLVQAVRDLLHCNQRPYVDYDIVQACDPYLTLWRGRMDSVPLLLEAVTNTATTPVTNSSAQYYTVGDLAWSLLIAMIPPLESVLFNGPLVASPRFKSCGECAIWDMLAAPGARTALKLRFARWLEQHRADLEWERLPGSPVDGRFRLRP